MEDARRLGFPVCVAVMEDWGFPMEVGGLLVGFFSWIEGGFCETLPSSAVESEGF